MTYVPSFEEWLAQSNYNEARKRALIEAKPLFDRRYANVCKCFVKDEAYDEEKYARGIMSYEDTVKANLGPVVHAAEKLFFSEPFFVKGMSNAERDERLRSLFTGEVLGTDFTSFEAHHRGIYAELFAEFIGYMLGGIQDNPETLDAVRLIQDLVLGKNVARFRGVTVTVDQRLMSGALWTSFQNSFLNLMVLKYLRSRSADQGHASFDVPNTLVEGDDGIMTPFVWDSNLVASMGLRLKLERSAEFKYASFCGRVVDEHSCVGDPLKVLLKLMWYPTKYISRSPKVMASLLKARAMSYLESYPGCPVISIVCWKIIRDLRSIDERVGESLLRTDTYRLPTLKTPLDLRAEPSIHADTRMLVEELYGLTIDQQIAIERSYDRFTVSLPFAWSREYVCNVYDRLAPEADATRELLSCDPVHDPKELCLAGRSK